MKIVLLITLFLTGTICLSSERAKQNYLMEQLKVTEGFIANEKKKRSDDISNLLQAKLFLINGNVKAAKHYLQFIKLNNTKIAPIKKRFLALIYFLEGDYKKSLKILQSRSFKNNNAYAQICMLKVFNMMVLDMTSKLPKEANRCQALTGKFSNNDQLWLTSMLEMKLIKDFKYIGGSTTKSPYLNRGNEIAKIWLKIGLYMNKEELVDINIGSLPEDAFKSKRIREIIAFVYYRLGEYDKALSFIEDVDSANAENIKGNVKLSQKKYELAFGHYQLALKRKANSKNAIERAIPLAWLLEQWKEGQDLLVKHTSADKHNKMALNAAFEIKQGNFQNAKTELFHLNRKFLENMPKKLYLMNSFISTMLDERVKKHDYADQACRKFDGVNCWLKLQHTIRKSIKSDFDQEGKVFKDSTIDINKLKQKVAIKELDEPIIINQNDIQELDSAEVTIPLSP